jgi:hypothetical protein
MLGILRNTALVAAAAMADSEKLLQISAVIL